MSPMTVRIQVIVLCFRFFCLPHILLPSPYPFFEVLNRFSGLVDLLPFFRPPPSPPYEGQTRDSPDRKATCTARSVFGLLAAHKIDSPGSGFFLGFVGPESLRSLPKTVLFTPTACLIFDPPPYSIPVYLLCPPWCDIYSFLDFIW